jgi:hypothetical protein
MGYIPLDSVGDPAASYGIHFYIMLQAAGKGDQKRWLVINLERWLGQNCSSAIRRGVSHGFLF